jgi:signal transduction histidine kinase
MRQMKRTILLVDDEPDGLESMSLLLADEYHVLTAESGQAALALLAREPVEAILADQRMPRMTGVELLGQAKELYPEVVRLLLTAYSDFDAMREAINTGQVYRYILKPCELEDLLITIRQALDWKDLQVTQSAQDERLACLMQKLPEGVLLLDRELRPVLVNPAARRHLVSLGRDRPTRPITSLGNQPLETLVAPRKNGLPQEVILGDPDPRVFEVTSNSICTGPQSGGWVLVLRDVTVERKIQAQIARQGRLAAVGELAAGIAHDFNNLLTSILGYSELLKQRLDLPDEAREDLDVIITQGHRGAELIRQVLDFSRKSVNTLSVLDLSSCLTSTRQLLTRTIPEIVNLYVEVKPGDYQVLGDPNQLQQVFTNLAINAQHAMPEGGDLLFQLSRQRLAAGERRQFDTMPDGDWVELRVTDTGSGMPEEVLGRVFEPFFTTKDPGQGTGLGLSQVYGIVKQHNGYIHVDSQEGKGTRFVIWLPATAQDTDHTHENAPAKLPMGQGETVLLVEDDLHVRTSFQRMLQYLNYQVLVAENGQEALAIHKTHQHLIAVVLTDMAMPKLSGSQLYQTLRKHSDTLPFILMSGYARGETAERLIANSNTQWLPKPPNPQSLAEALAKALKRPT